jgi:CubicO group peptidase (beta-lactamase class C family)
VSVRAGEDPWAALDGFLASLVEGGLFSAAVGLVGSCERILWTGAAGLARPSPPRAASPATRFDLASLTKPFVASLALRLDALGLLPLELPVGEVWSRAHRPLARRPLEALLRHRAGLVAWTPLYARCSSRHEALALLLSGSCLGARPGTYSDLDYVLWALAAEARLGKGAEPLLRRHLLEPLGLGRIEASPGEAPDIALCLIDTAREVELAAEQRLLLKPLPAPALGQVQDGNARFLTAHERRARRGARAPAASDGGSPMARRRAAGALAGHAGLFGRAEDLWRLGSEWLRPSRLLSRDQVAHALSGAGSYALGWARRRVRGSAGPALSPRSFGHVGFTGGSLWLDPAAGRILVLLGHRTSPRSSLNGVRHRFHHLGLRL